LTTKIGNPLGTWALWLTVFVLGYVGLQYFVGSDLLTRGLKPLLFFSACFFCVWIVFQYRTGEISLYSSAGRKNTYRRRSDPIMFHAIVVVGLLMGLFLSVALASDVFLSCEYSLLNPCRQ
jgi:hypothetical protein